jgi:hypothetical protein
MQYGIKSVQFFTAENLPPIDIHQQMKVVYGNDCIDISTVRNWAEPVRDANLGHASLN